MNNQELALAKKLVAALTERLPKKPYDAKESLAVSEDGDYGIEVLITPGQWALPTDSDKPKVEIVFRSMYGNNIPMTFEIIADVCGSREINIGKEEGGGGCDTCGYNGMYRLPIFVHDAVL
jgi:hypothetical protein